MQSTQSKSSLYLGSMFLCTGGGIELSLAAMPGPDTTVLVELNEEVEDLEFHRTLNAVIEGPIEQLRVQVGNIKIQKRRGQITFFAYPDLSSRIIAMPSDTC